jgi:hypothetical protein
MLPPWVQIWPTSGEFPPKADSDRPRGQGNGQQAIIHEFLGACQERIDPSFDRSVGISN